jgi:uncharacterized membrane protein YebE (DUF533 family)
MNNNPPRFLKSFYRKEPITGIIITAGAVNAVLGGVNAIGSLMLLGLFAAGGAIAYRWWMMQQAEARREAGSQLYLPPAAQPLSEYPAAYSERRSSGQGRQ